ncbi:MAG: aspartyl/asparaginyl beta-hydroxylase domain-containing protein [Chitinophagales bacterium]|nr:aspartyl/asparaginyl beta-hydroxylase domain-containing protein [Chitinophagales bacterium]MDW8417796.1 aspartyl/asparaginyl beta-hydroxylase domain-containing protein [Chitinophagales bacterium]
MSNSTEPLIIHLRNNYYNGKLPAFYTPEQFPDLKVLSDHWQEIRDELIAYEQKHGPLQGLSTYSPPGTSNDSPWSNLYLENFLWRYYKNRKYFPKTCAIIDKIPGLTFAAFAALNPGGTLTPHYGDTNAVIRCHLGLKIPAPHPVCGIRVADEERGWEEGKLLLFSEAHLHTVWNYSNERRYIFCVDIIHPNWEKRRWWICARVLGAQSWVFIENRLWLLKKIPEPIALLLSRLLAIVWYIYLPLQRVLWHLVDMVS